MSNSVQPHRRKPTRLPHPWDSPGKNTGVGCHFLFQCMKVKSEREVTQSCLTLGDPMDYSPPGSCIHGTFQARVLEWGAIDFSKIIHKDRHTAMEQNQKPKTNPCIYNWHTFHKGVRNTKCGNYSLFNEYFLGKLEEHKIGYLSYMIHKTVLIMD